MAPPPAPHTSGAAGHEAAAGAATYLQQHHRCCPAQQPAGAAPPAQQPYAQPCAQPYAGAQPYAAAQGLPLSLPVLPVPPYAQQLGPGYVQLYDDTTQEVVVASSVLANELARQGHSLAPLHEAYRSKLAALQATVNGSLLAKRDALLQQHARLAARAGEVAAKRAALEREAAALADDMIRRLRSAESLKQALLGREQAEVDVSADDLPAEAAVHADLASAHSALQQLLGVKDAMIAHLLRERDELQVRAEHVVEA
ncbi:hypothetical protein GPECTOR_39g439 [Gonium pectorale]|uniref:Uncharacterized protein n=1 Tax=Gonium pectorale TaxID=33097 RepID=A0A150GBK3_GONPE|nr:hypothetical protein GPECTOR_39g439 [Gonium pectorale]|eukprot:KXZ46945.1 hypothetical protein GPECTOR_39g439 [Gonium pectorale]